MGSRQHRTEDEELLGRVGGRVRTRRKALGWTVRQLAEASELSPRFVTQLEAGEGNIAIGRLDRVARALGVGLEALVGPDRAAGAQGELEELLGGRDPTEVRRVLALAELLLGVRRPRVVALLGMRGAGKSSVGPRVARRLAVPFVELDAAIEASAGMALAEIWQLHGDPYYRRLEQRCLADLVARGEPLVVALPGGVVGNPEAFQLVEQGCVPVWLEARPEDHMRRVLAQGDRRPVADRADAMAELRALLAAREPQYRRAPVRVDTSQGTVAAAAAAVLAGLERVGYQA